MSTVILAKIMKTYINLLKLYIKVASFSDTLFVYNMRSDVTIPGGSKKSHLTKCNFSTADTDFFTKISGFRICSGRSCQQSLKMSPKYFYCFKNYSFDNILFRIWKITPKKWTVACNVQCSTLLNSFCARQHVCAHMLSQFRLSVRPSACLSVTRVDQSKTVEVRIMQFSPYSSPIALIFAL